MARRADHSRDELYRMALGAAREIVARDGWRALTARSVAHGIGYSAGTLYNLFENLDDLVAHVNGTTLDALHDHLSAGPVAATPEAAVDRLLRRYLAFLDANEALCELLFDHGYRAGYKLPAWYEDRVARVLEILTRALTPIAGGRAADAARALWASLHGICTLARGGRLALIGAGSRADMAHLLTDNFMAGLRARAAISAW